MFRQFSFYKHNYSLAAKLPSSTMFSRVSSFFIAMMAFTIFAAAMPGGTPPKTVTVTATQAPATTPVPQCSTGSLKCCDSVQTAGSLPSNVLLGLLTVLLGDLTALVGVTCSPLDILAIGGDSCNTQAACCTGNTFNGLVTLGCSPINLNL